MAEEERYLRPPSTSDCGGPVTIGSTEDVQEILTWHGRWAAAVRGGEPEAITNLYAPDGRFMGSYRPPDRGRAAILRAWTGFFRLRDVTLTWEPDTIEVSGGRDLAYEVGSYRMTANLAQGQAFDRGSYVLVWKKINEGWRIAIDISHSTRPVR